MVLCCQWEVEGIRHQVSPPRPPVDPDDVNTQKIFNQSLSNFIYVGRYASENTRTTASVVKRHCIPKSLKCIYLHK